MTSSIKLVNLLLSKFDKTGINIVISFICKVGSAFIGFLIIPVLINDIGKTDYGIYLTITSFCLLTQILDFGVNNTIKNKISSFVAKEDYTGASRYYSNSYFFIAIIFVLVIASLLLILVTKTTWVASIFSMDSITPTWFYCIFMIIIFSLFNFLAMPGINLYYCIDKTYYVYIITFCSQLAGFIIYYAFRNIAPNRMVLLCVTIYGVPFLCNLLSVLALQLRKNILVKFHAGYINFKFLKGILGNSVNFFFIQIASIVQFQVGNFLISTHFPSQKVTEYNSYNKYFSIVQILLTVIVTPFWISFAKYKGQNDIPGLKKEFRKFSYLIIGLISILIVQFFIGKIVFKLWLHDKIIYDYSIAVFFMLYYAMYFAGVVFVIFVNSVLNVKWQMYTSFISVLLFLYLFNVTSPIFGIAGIAISLMISNFYAVTVAPIQVYRYFKSIRPKKSPVV